MAEPTLSFEVPAEELAPPGISGNLLSVQTRPETTNEEARRLLADTSERDFEVRCVFSRDTGFTRDMSAQSTFDIGTSFFQPPEDQDAGFFVSGGLRFETVLNAQREIAGVRCRVRARSLREARESFSRGVAPVLDHLAYLADTPLIDGPPACYDEKNLIWLSGYTSPYHTKIINPGHSTLYSELAPVYGLYREAKNTISPFYRFFCCYKILEGIFLTLRPRLFGRARNLGVKLTKQKELIPDHRELRTFASDLIGRPVKEYFDNVLQKQFRDAVAHFVLNTGQIVTPSDPIAVAEFSDIILVTELCCRTVIDQHEKYLRQMSASPGTPVTSG